jgi:hypothetical protein
MGKETRRSGVGLGSSLRKCGVQGWSTLRVQPARRTEQPPKKRAALLAFGEISYEEGLGEVASMAVIYKSS